MKLNVLGTGTFFATIDRTASAYVLEWNGKKALIDCGPGTLVRLSQMGIKPEDLNYIFITHFHPDHTSELFPLFMNYRLRDLFDPGSITNFPIIFGPPGIEKYLIEYARMAELPAYEGWGKIVVHDFESKIEIDNAEVKPYKVKHGAFGIMARAYALRFESEGKTVVFSGDTQDCEGIRQACLGADLFVCDASYPKNIKLPAHMNTVEIGEIATNSKVKKIMLTHFYPQYDKIDLVAEVKEKFAGEVEHGQDLSIIEV
ncbi:MAG: MBL fold metallo-hydrolase [Microgenomates group bacterium]